jgi:nucleotide-binding universal stress UspA family protein
VARRSVGSEQASSTSIGPTARLAPTQKLPIRRAASPRAAVDSPARAVDARGAARAASRASAIAWRAGCSTETTAMFPFRRILAPVDFSACSEAAVDLAIAIAERFAASITLLHAWELPAAVVVPLALPHARMVPNADDRAATVRSAARSLEAFAERLRRSTTVEIDTQLAEGLPHEAIEAASRDFDLVVMGTHGRGVLAHAILGSVAERVVRACACPVLTARPESAHDRRR